MNKKEDEQTKKAIKSMNPLIHAAADTSGIMGYMIGTIDMLIIFVFIKVIGYFTNDATGWPIGFLCTLIFGIVTGKIAARLLNYEVEKICEKFYIKIDEKKEDK